MALSDILKTRKADKIHKHAWGAIWQEFKDAPEEPGPRLTHALYMGALLYATRRQACRVAGMDESVAQAAALKAVIDAGYDEAMRDRLLGVFDPGPEGAPGMFAEALTTQVNSIVAAARAAGRAPLGSAVDGRLADLRALLPEFGEAVG